jgi:peptidoglycan hydrolase CwlO-like protein
LNPTASWGASLRSNRCRHVLLSAGAVALAATLLSPAPGSAQEPSTEDQLDDVRSQSAAVAAEIDVLNARSAELQTALNTIQTRVAEQQVAANAAEDALAVAESNVAESEAAVAALQAEIAELDATTDRMVVTEFVNPPMDHALDMFDADTLSEATVKTAIVELQTEADNASLERLGTAKSELESEQADLVDLAAVAATRKEEADSALADLEANLTIQQQFATEVEAVLNARLAEAQALASRDATLSRQLAAEQAAIAAALAAAQAQPDPDASTVSAPAGGLADVTCPGGGSITVAGSIAGNLSSLLEAANAAGIVMCGGGYRDPQEQIELRKAHCGTSDYAIYEMPSSDCSPPTARPGSSMHEQGLAVDFTCNGGGTVSSGDVCDGWLESNAATYGFYNLPSEPWHYSTNGN